MTAHEVDGDRGQEDLTAIGLGAQTRRHVDRMTDVVGAPPLCLTGMEPESAPDIAAGSDSHIALEPSMSDRQNVITPVGSASAQPARRRSTSSPGVAGRRAGSVAIPSRSAASNCSACAGSIPSQDGSTPAGADR
jgi:hypothetical protein